MLKKLSTTVLIGLISLSTIQAQDIIPFRLNKHNNILVKALINQKDSVELMFQIAMQEGSLAPNRKNKVESVQFDHDEFPEGLSKGNLIQVAQVKVDKLWIWDNELTGPEAEGKIGTQLFGKKIFKINYDKSQFETFEQLPNINKYKKIPIEFQNGQIFILGTSWIDKKQEDWKFLLQSGYAGAILYDQEFSRKHQLPEKLKVHDELIMKNSQGKEVKTMKGTLDAFTLTGFKFQKIPVGIFESDITVQRVSYLGADFIRRFNWIIDLQNNTAYMEKSKYFKEPYLSL